LEQDKKPVVLLISFYNQKSLGLRYLENALEANGFGVEIVYFKRFNSVNPQPASEAELALLGGLIRRFSPVFVGLSVMTSLYLETVETVNAYIKANFGVPVVWGGVFPSMFAERCLGFADYVLRGEGETPVVGLARAFSNGGDPRGINNLCYKENGEPVLNDLNDLCTDLDGYGVPTIGKTNKRLIDCGELTEGDPLVNALSYELGASRGCPFACSYCCSINLSRLNRGKGKFVRFREVDRVIEELKNAKANMKRLKVVHFWDEVFCDDEGWIDAFAERYKKEIGLPFEIWGHPLKTSEELIRKLKSAGLYKVVMGIQSGSPYIRKEIFNRPEKQEDILRASGILRKCGVPQVVYDFMLRHPFETVETIRETYELAEALDRPFELQLHGLYFLPGTDIVNKALDMGLVTPEDMERIMYAPISEQYKNWWKSDDKKDDEINFWYSLIFLTQFNLYKRKRRAIAARGMTPENLRKLKALVGRGEKLAKLRYYYRKGMIVAKGTLAKNIFKKI